MMLFVLTYRLNYLYKCIQPTCHQPARVSEVVVLSSEGLVGPDFCTCTGFRLVAIHLNRLISFSLNIEFSCLKLRAAKRLFI